GQLFAEYGGQLLHRQLHFENMPARLIPRTGIAVAFWSRQGRTGIAFPLAHASGTFGAKTKLGNLDLRQGDANEIVALLADHLAAADVLAQVAFHLAADELPKALVIAF